MFLAASTAAVRVVPTPAGNALFIESSADQSLASQLQCSGPCISAQQASQSFDVAVQVPTGRRKQM